MCNLEVDIAIDVGGLTGNQRCGIFARRAAPVQVNYLGYPAVDPHGDPIPRADGSLAETAGTPLARCRPGQHFRVVRVMDQDPAFLRYLSECGLDLHATGELLENRPEAGAIVCRLGERSVALGLTAAGKVLVVPGDPMSSAT